MVRGGIGQQDFKAFYNKPGKDGWHGLSSTALEKNTRRSRAGFECLRYEKRMGENEMKRNSMYKAFAGLLAMIVIMCAVVIGWEAAEPEQTKPAETEAEPLGD